MHSSLMCSQVWQPVEDGDFFCSEACVEKYNKKQMDEYAAELEELEEEEDNEEPVPPELLPLRRRPDAPIAMVCVTPNEVCCCARTLHGPFS